MQKCLQKISYALKGNHNTTPPTHVLVMEGSEERISIKWLKGERNESSQLTLGGGTVGGLIAPTLVERWELEKSCHPHPSQCASKQQREEPSCGVSVAGGMVADIHGGSQAPPTPNQPAPQAVLLHSLPSCSWCHALCFSLCCVATRSGQADREVYLL